MNRLITALLMQSAFLTCYIEVTCDPRLLVERKGGIKHCNLYILNKDLKVKNNTEINSCSYLLRRKAFVSLDSEQLFFKVSPDF